MSGISDLFKNYGITGNPTIDALILAHIIPLIITYSTVFFSFLKNYLCNFFERKLHRTYDNFKDKFLGKVDHRLFVSQDRNIYPTIKSVFFSTEIKSDNIDNKTLGILNLVTESRDDRESRYYPSCYYYQSLYDLYLDSSNNVTIEKRLSHGGSISKKFFKHENYYIVVSENKRNKYTYYYHDEEDMVQDDDKKKDDKNNKDDPNHKKEYFILFEAIRISNNIPKDENIIKKFLYDRFQLNIRIPYKYVIKVSETKLYLKLSGIDSYKDYSTGELAKSDGLFKFLNNPKVRDFYNHREDLPEEKINGIPSFTSLDHKGTSLNVNKLEDHLIIRDIQPTTSVPNLFEGNFNSILSYFFGKRFNLQHLYNMFFYFNNNKIIMCFKQRINGCHERYICIVSFQEILTHESFVKICKDLLEDSNNDKQKSTSINVYNYINNSWKKTECDSRSYDTIYLPLELKKQIISEMDKFICFEKIFGGNGIPYKKGFLFYGPPGTGKTSLVKALAYMYNIPIYSFDINNSTINDENITTVINSISSGNNRILLFEDIDSAFATKEELKSQAKHLTIPNETNPITKSNEKSLTNDKNNDDNATKATTTVKYLTYSGLLNALDGVMSGQHGTILIMTTNYHQKLGQALIRPGRIDFCIELTFCDRYQIVEMTRNIINRSYKIIQKENEDSASNLYRSNIKFHCQFTDDELNDMIEKFADNLMQGGNISKIRPCSLQVHILRYIDNIQDIFDKYHEMLKGDNVNE